MKTLEALLGKANTSAVPLGLFGERFQLVPTIGKLVNLSPEADSSDRPHMGTLKAFTAGDPLTIDRKGLPQITVTPTAKLIISANSRPTFVDRSDGLWRRLEVIPFNITIPAEKQGAGLVGRLSSELPGIFNWALIGLKRLRSQNAFTKSAVVQAAVEEYKLESNSARMFINECGLSFRSAGASASPRCCGKSRLLR